MINSCSDCGSSATDGTTHAGVKWVHALQLMLAVWAGLVVGIMHVHAHCER